MKTYTVVYRTGGFRNPVWKSTFPYNVRQDAERTQKQMQMSGTKALIYTLEELEKNGLPHGWEPQQEFFTDEVKPIAEPGPLLDPFFQEQEDEPDKAAQMIAECQAVPMPTQEDLKKAQKFQTMANGVLSSKIDDCFADRQENTPKRQCEAMHKRNEGTWLKRTQQALKALAAGYCDGTLPGILKDLKSKKEIHALMRPVYEGGQGYYDAPQDTGKPADKSEKSLALWKLIDGGRSEAEQKKEELHRKIEGLQFSKIPGYFPTPRAVVELMIERANIEDGNHILEPSAGAGAIADVIKEKYPSVTVEVSEVNYTLQEILQAKGYELVSPNFMEYLDNFQYDRILMNPPFENLQDIDHVTKAYCHLFEGGRLVSIMSPAPFFRTDKKSTFFREWFERLGGECVDLPDNSFKQSGTGVASKLIILDKD